MSINEYFLGLEMSVLSCDKFAYEHIEGGVLQEDLTLMDHKWWDYRAMHPTHATLYFYGLYNHIVGSYISKYISNIEGGKFAKYSAKMDLRQRPLATIRAFWKARMAADAIGVPYEIYIRAMLDNFYGSYHKFASTSVGKQKQPYPAQMTSNIIIGQVIKEWDAVKSSKLILPESELVLHKQLWFRPDMEASLRDNAKLTDHCEFFLEKAVRVGAILGPA